jgi:hypothetical protein
MITATTATEKNLEIHEESKYFVNNSRKTSVASLVLYREKRINTEMIFYHIFTLHQVKQEHILLKNVKTTI